MKLELSACNNAHRIADWIRVGCDDVMSVMVGLVGRKGGRLNGGSRIMGTMVLAGCGGRGFEITTVVVGCSNTCSP